MATATKGSQEESQHIRTVPITSLQSAPQTREWCQVGKEGQRRRFEMDRDTSQHPSKASVSPGSVASVLNLALLPNQSFKEQDAALARKVIPPPKFLAALAHQSLLAPCQEINLIRMS